MTRTKKAVSLILAVVMVLSMFAINAFAAGETASFAVTTSNGSANIANGDTITVTVSATTNYYAGPTGVVVTYDATSYDLVSNSVTCADIFGANATEKLSETTVAGKVKVIITPDTAAAPVASKLNGTTLFTFQLTAKVANATTTIAVDTTEEKSSTNGNGNWYCGISDSTDLKTSNVVPFGATMSATPATVNIAGGVAEPNTLVVKDDAPQTPVIDTTNKTDDITGTIYGIDTLDQNDDMTVVASIADCLTTTLGDEFLKVTAADCGLETTGTVIEVLDADGATVLETYVFVYFGDIDADGMISANDGTIAEYYEGNYTGIDTFIQYMAADIDGDGMPSANDATIAEYYEGNYTGVTNQETIAALAVNNSYELI